MTTTLSDSLLDSPTLAGSAPESSVRRVPAYAWARDFALVGAVSSLLAPLLLTGTMLGLPTLIVTCLAGGLSGLAVGELSRRALTSPIGRAPWPLLVLLMAAGGALWGAFVGLVGSFAMFGGVDVDSFAGREYRSVGPIVGMFIMWAAMCASAQLAWFGVAYHRARAVGAPGWPLVIAACGTPFLGYAGLFGLSWL